MLWLLIALEGLVVQMVEIGLKEVTGNQISCLSGTFLRLVCCLFDTGFNPLPIRFKFPHLVVVEALELSI